MSPPSPHTSQQLSIAAEESRLARGRRKMDEATRALQHVVSSTWLGAEPLVQALRLAMHHAMLACVSAESSAEQHLAVMRGCPSSEDPRFIEAALGVGRAADAMCHAADAALAAFAALQASEPRVGAASLPV